jgi:hypothetical protein
MSVVIGMEMEMGMSEQGEKTLERRVGEGWGAEEGGMENDRGWLAARLAFTWGCRETAS